MNNIFKKTIFFLSLCCILIACNNQSPYIKNNTGSLNMSVSGEKNPHEDIKNIYLSGVWYRQDNTLFPDEHTWVLSGDHYRYAISFEIKNKKKLLKECRENIKNSPNQWIFLCTSKGDDARLETMFDRIDGNIVISEKDLIKILSSNYSRVHSAKYVSPGKIIFSMGSIQDAIAIFPVYLSKIDDDNYLQISAYPDIICDNDPICKSKIPILNEKTGLDPYWDFIWSGVTGGKFYDPLIKETYDQMFLTEKNWQSITKNAIEW